MSEQNELQNRLKNGKTNINIFDGAMVGMSVTTIFMAFATGVSSPGTLLAASLTGLFVGLTLASRKRVSILERKTLQ